MPPDGVSERRAGGQWQPRQAGRGLGLDGGEVQLLELLRLLRRRLTILDGVARLEVSDATALDRLADLLSLVAAQVEHNGEILRLRAEEVRRLVKAARRRTRQHLD